MLSLATPADLNEPLIDKFWKELDTIKPDIDELIKLE